MFQLCHLLGTACHTVVTAHCPLCCFCHQGWQVTAGHCRWYKHLDHQEGCTRVSLNYIQDHSCLFPFFLFSSTAASRVKLPCSRTFNPWDLNCLLPDRLCWSSMLAHQLLGPHSHWNFRNVVIIYVIPDSRLYSDLFALKPWMESHTNFKCMPILTSLAHEASAVQKSR